MNLLRSLAVLMMGLCLVGSVQASTVAQFTKVETKQIMDEFISIFENSSLELQYAYVKNLHDGRGYTAGRSGFTTRDGDLLNVVKYYLKLHADSDFKSILPTLEDRARDESGSISGLSTLPKLWIGAAREPDFKKAQDHVSDALYFKPATKQAKEVGLESPLSILCLYDAAIEQGVEGPDGIQDMISKVPPLSKFKSEQAWLTAFHKVRRQTLLNPQDADTQAVWADSVDRVDALQNVVSDGNLDLVPPITVTAFGGTYTVE